MDWKGPVRWEINVTIAVAAFAAWIWHNSTLFPPQMSINLYLIRAMIPI